MKKDFSKRSAYFLKAYLLKNNSSTGNWFNADYCLLRALASIIQASVLQASVLLFFVSLYAFDDVQAGVGDSSKEEQGLSPTAASQSLKQKDFPNRLSDRLLPKDTEALSQIQDVPFPLPKSMAQDVDIIGLYALSLDSTEFISVASNGKISLWTLKKGEETVLFPAGEGILACAYDPINQVIATAQDTKVSLFDLNARRRIAISPSFVSKASSLEFQPDGGSLLIGGEDGKVYRWRLKSQNFQDTRSKIEVERYIGHSAAVTALSYHPFSRIFLSADSFGTLAAWLTYDKDLFGGKYDEKFNQTTYYTEDAPRALAATAEATTALALRVSKDGQNFFVSMQDGRIEWRLVRGLKLVMLAKTHKGAIYDLQLSPSGKRLASVARDGFLRVWDLVSLERPGQVVGGKELVSHINDFNKDSLGYFSLVKELPLENARKLLFASETSVIVGESTGRLLEISL